MGQNVQNKKDQLKKASHKFFSNNSIYGLSRAFSTKKKLNKIIWTICAILSAIYGLVIIGENYLEYHQYDVFTKTQTIEQNTAVFPTIIICPGLLTNGTLILSSAYVRIGSLTKSYPLNQSSNDSGDCIRFNAFNGKTIPLVEVSGTNHANSFNFILKFRDHFIIYIIDNFINSYLTYDKINLDPNLSYQLRISKTVDIKQEEPYNHCTDVSDPTYRQIDCQQKCVYERYAAKYNCSFVAFRSFLANELCNDKCLNENSEDRVKSKSDSYDFSLAAKDEFGADCLKICPKECINIKYSTEITARGNTSMDPIYENETLFTFFFMDLNYIQTSQIPKITISSLISNIGGALGVFIGLNFLSMVELVEFFVEALYIIYS